jgi:hypothetical protein
MRQENKIFKVRKNGKQKTQRRNLKNLKRCLTNKIQKKNERRIRSKNNTKQ